MCVYLYMTESVEVFAVTKVSFQWRRYAIIYVICWQVNWCVFLPPFIYLHSNLSIECKKNTKAVFGLNVNWLACWYWRLYDIYWCNLYLQEEEKMIFFFLPSLIILWTTHQLIIRQLWQFSGFMLRMLRR